jgi:hypothetical protein
VLYTLHFAGWATHTVEVDALDLDEALGQCDDFPFHDDTDVDIEWHYHRATLDGRVIQEEPSLHEQLTTEANGLNDELTKTRRELEFLRRQERLLDAATTFEFTGPQGTATVTRHLGKWFVHHTAAGPEGWAQYTTRPEAIDRAQELVA